MACFITPASRRAFAAAWRDGRTFDEIAYAFGCSRATALRTARRLDLPPRRRGPRPSVDPAAVAALWQAGIATLEIARRLATSPSTVRRTARRACLPPRPIGRPGRAACTRQETDR